MSYVLRDYQAQAVARSVQFLRQGAAQGGLVVLPTGAGKSLVIAGVVEGLDAPCLIFQPSKEILEQNANKLLSYGFEPKIFSASMQSREIGTITLATIGSVVEYPHLFDHFPYIVIDECHRVNSKDGQYKEFLAALGDIRVVGLTATPYRLSSDAFGGSQLKFLTRTRPRVFSEVLSYAQIPDLITKGHLVKPTYQIVSGFSAKELKLNATGADYDDESVRHYYNRINFPDRVRRVVLRLLEIGRTRILVFTRFVDDAMALAAAVPGAAVVSAQTPKKEREAIVTAFRTGEIPVCCNVGVLMLGFDYPELSTVVCARPTLSLTVFYQQCGRVLRPFPGKDAWIVDMVDNLSLFGKIEDLWLMPNGASGQQWEVVSKTNGQHRVLTNRYFGSGKFKRKWRAKPKAKL